MVQSLNLEFLLDNFIPACIFIAKVTPDEVEVVAMMRPYLFESRPLLHEPGK
jgi:hypothetical protein